MLNLFQLLFIIFFSFLNANTSFSSSDQPPPPKDLNFPVASKDTTPKEYVVPRTAKTESLEKIRESKSCKDYLAICERSCKERGSMFKFQCIGQDFQPFEDHSRCTCADELYSHNDAQRKPQIQLQQNQGEAVQ